MTVPALTAKDISKKYGEEPFDTETFQKKFPHVIKELDEYILKTARRGRTETCAIFIRRYYDKKIPKTDFEGLAEYYFTYGYNIKIVPIGREGADVVIWW